MHDAKYNMYQYMHTHYKNIGDIPEVIKDEYDLESLKAIVDFKFDPDTVYLNYPGLDTDIENDGDGCSFYGANYEVTVAEFTGLSECEIKNRALELTIYNKIGNLFQLYKATVENFNMVLEGDMTVKGFIKRIEITDDNKC